MKPDIDKLFKEYIDQNNCCAEFLATEEVPAGTTYEEAFKTYIELMKQVEGDQFFTIKEQERIEL